MPSDPAQPSASVLGPQGLRKSVLFLWRMSCSTMKGNTPSVLASRVIWVQVFGRISLVLTKDVTV